MRVCIVVEGTYPYIVGGVSSWVQMLIENMPDIEFDVVHLAPWRWNRPFSYKMPKNLKHVHEYLLFSCDFSRSKDSLNERELISFVRQLIELKQQRAHFFAKVLRSVAGKHLDWILQSQAFWNFITDVYERYFFEEGFTGFYWTVIGFMIPILSAVQSVPPKADLYHSTTTGYAALSALTGKYVHGGKLIVTEHGIYHREREIEITKSTSIPEVYKKPWIEIFKLISETAYMECDALTTLFEKNQLFQLELNADFSKMYVIPNGIDVEKFLKIQRTEHDGFNIGIVGRVVPIKGITTGIKAFDIVIKEVPNSKLYIIGPTDEDEDYYERCLGLVKRLNLEDKVIFTGRADVSRYYGMMDVLLISSISEGQPLVQLEAMACGVPTVVTNVGNCAEIALDSDGQSGFVVEPGDYVSMAEKLVLLAKDESLRKIFSENGRRIVKEKYTLQRMIEAYRKLYAEVVKDGWNRL
ncbi:GT4 family glycosyltransferase PelF [Pseudothermotoga sp.]